MPVDSTTVLEEGRPVEGRPSLPLARRRRSWSWFGLLPFFVFVAVFLIWPTIVIAMEAFKNKDGHFGISNLVSAMQDDKGRSFVTTANLSLITALIGGVVGILLAYAICTLERPRFLKKAVTTFSGVASQLGGVPLAFAFIAALGTRGIITLFFNERLHIDLLNFGSIYTFRGVAIVYLYFQIPLMVIVMLPAIEGLKATYREAAENLGASKFRYWIHVGLPLLAPAAVSGLVLLFANAFSAYATAYALTAGQVNLVSIQIGFYLSGNVLDDPGLGYALAFWMIVFMALAIVIYQLLQRRTSRWLR
jgi:putative spermidine/putrescine transport system permease protein